MASRSKRNGIEAFYAEVFQLRPPCIDCESFSLCAEEELACQTFNDWVRSDTISDRSRSPNKAYYKKLFASPMQVSEY